jgi:predicted nucleic acid-binding protein
MIVADTSALVSLASGSVLDLFLDEFEVVVSEVVFEELEDLSQEDDLTAENAEKVLASKDLMELREVGGELPVSSRVDEGEASCVVVARELNADFLITDDLRALPGIESMVGEDKVAISPIVIRALTERGVLDMDEALSKLERIGDRRDWLHRPIFRRARKLFED